MCLDTVLIDNAKRMKLNFDKEVYLECESNPVSVLNYYMLLVYIVYFHMYIFFSIVILANKCNTNDDVTPGEVCAEDLSINKNMFLLIFYVLTCCFLCLSGLQVKYGQPEVMRSYFMLQDFTPFNKYMHLIFYNIPFLFEFRVSIDWTFTNSSLDVF